eukprot:6211741-Pleurochrysis_carterae.AAC.11
MAIVGEMLAAREVAKLKPVISFGFDETRKFQVGTLSTHVQGETRFDRTVDIVMRRAFVIEVGTAEQVVNAVAKKVFTRGRKLLARWLDKFNAVAADGGGTAWIGPQPNDLAVARLAGSLVMIDTCNAARTTKRRLAAVVEAAAQQACNARAWEAMGAAE